jgi:hypothetical protein
MTATKAIFLPVALLLCHCSSSSTSDGHTAPDKVVKPAEDASANLASPLTVSISIPQVAPGYEGTKCQKVRLGNSNALKIGQIHNKLSAASHHLVVSAVTDPAETESDPFDCSPFRAVLIGAPLTVTQKHDDTIPMPDGVGFPLVADQLMHLEMHFINTGTETVDVEATSELFPRADPENVEEAAFIIIGSLDIKIPPKTAMDLPWSFVTLPEAFAGVNFFGATGHTHRFGTATRLQIAGPAGADPKTIYDPPNFTWTEAELKLFAPYEHVPAGGGFRFQCAWDNQTDSMVTYGESALQEMCFFWTYYYPHVEGNRVLLAGRN